ncbi:MAG: aspartyl/glutamyl-tRNA amidotransferase subunit C [Nitrososphaerota archaeon]|jgi:aspartyl/glutamyl-tRNA(Asn/Gln) amidotransferase C subunit|nr:aspartyl/glutamyl-tRNA amidotransferase subunit C [Nitrososphaerota archaeon]
MTKPKITVEQVRRLGDLAKLSISATDEERLMGELSSILEYFEVVDKVSDDTRIDRQTEDPGDLRPDEVAPSSPDRVMNGVPQRKGNLVKAPRVF